MMMCDVSACAETIIIILDETTYSFIRIQDNFECCDRCECKHFCGRMCLYCNNNIIDNRGDLNERGSRAGFDQTGGRL